MRIVALLRGINVGGKNLIKMPALKACFERVPGVSEVSTYIASGNVAFTAAKATTALATKLSRAIRSEFGAEVPVTLRDAKQLQAVLKSAPRGFGQQPKKYGYNVIFLFEPLKSREAVKHIELREGVDGVATGPGVLYAWRLAARASSSKISKIVYTPIYSQLTIRNWNTTVALRELTSA
ncbi:MAG: DUF1697 domain-containing protein [Archangium sp.]